jgi:hypothetical protein
MTLVPDSEPPLGLAATLQGSGVAAPKRGHWERRILGRLGKTCKVVEKPEEVLAGTEVGVAKTLGNNTGAMEEATREGSIREGSYYRSHQAFGCAVHTFGRRDHVR